MARKRQPEVSPHEVRVFNALTDRWATSQEVADRAEVYPRTTRRHLTRLVAARLAEVVQVHRYRYRRHPNPDQANPEYLEQLTLAAKAFGLTINHSPLEFPHDRQSDQPEAAGPG